MATQSSSGYQWRTVIGGVVMIIVSTAIIIAFELISGGISIGRNKTLIPNPEITVKGIEENRGKVMDKLEQSDKLNKISLYKDPLQTPSFITNPEKLSQYLETHTASITIIGEISEAYIYIKTGPIDIENESVYFWIVDGKSDGGHLSPRENLTSNNGNVFLYDLEKLPVVDLPYSIGKTPSHLDIVNNYLNKDIPHKSSKQYYAGAFVSTTRFPNQVESFEIRYGCKSTSTCSISLNQ